MRTTRLILTLFIAAVAQAQTTGGIEGNVTDPSQAAMPGVIVKVTSEATGVVTSTTTNGAGYFLFGSLPVGVYDVAVNHTGFKGYSIKGIKLDVTARIRHNIVLEVGSIQDSVTVEASPVQVETTGGAVSAVITREQIATAVLNGRNYARLAMLMPGAVYHSGSDELSGAGLNSSGSPVSINGINNKASGWFLDGAYNMNMGNGEANPHVPVIDSLEEVRVQTSNYSAVYGTTGGSVITAVTRSGTSSFHGSAYEYLRNDKLDARNFFSATAQPLKQNQYGFTIGGPVIFPHYNRNRNKTFFFWSEDWRKRRSAQTILTATPTQDMRDGNFQAEAARTRSAIVDPNTKAPFPNNIIPASRINPNAAILLKTYFPLPNNPGGGFNNYINNGVGKLDPRTDTVKIDHNFSDKLRVSFKIAKDNISVLNPNVQLSPGSPFPTLRQGESTNGWIGAARANMVFSPRTTNELGYAFKKVDINLIIEDTDAAPQVRPAGIKIRDFYPDANTLRLIPNIGLSQGWGGIGNGQLPLKPATDDNGILNDNFSRVIGQHTLQAGGTWFHYNKTQAIFNTTTGSYTFDGSVTTHPVADFMLGLARTYGQGNERFTRSYTVDQTEWHLQDDWRVSRKLTLNLGARLFVIPLLHVSGDKASSFLPERYDPAKAPQLSSAGILTPTPNYDPLNGIVFPQQGGVPRGFANTVVGLAPRFGFAFDPTGSGKMALRGGYGISYLNSGNNDSGLVLNPPFNIRVDLNNVLLDDPSGGVPNAPRPVSLNAYNSNFIRPMVQSWSLTVQRELPGQFLASAGYVGTRGTNWEVWFDRNAPDFGARVPGLDFDTRLNSNTIDRNLLRPFQGYGSITQYNTGLSSTYHSLQTTFQRRFANSLALQGVYTWSKAVGEAQTRRDMQVQNPLNWRADRGPTDYDRTHVFSFNYIYTLPLFRGRRDLVGQALGNWEVSGFLSLQSGLAMSPGISLGTRGLATRPNATGLSTEGAKTKEVWFNTAAFAAPAPGTYGNAGTGVIRGPGFGIWDFSASKQFPIREKVKLKFAGEFYNVLNHTNWSGVSTSLGSGNYGSITSARDPRKVQLSLRMDF